MCHFSATLEKQKKWSLRIFEIQFPMFFYVCSGASRNERRSLKNEIENPTFVDVDIRLINQDEDYDNYSTPDTTPSRVDEISFTVPDASEVTSTLRLRQKVKRDKIVSLYRYLDVTGDRGLADLNRLKIQKNSKAGNIEVLFLNGNNDWQSFNNKRTGEFLAPKTLRERFGRLNIMKSILRLDKAPPSLGRSISAASKLKTELPTDLQMETIPSQELSSLTKDIHIKTQESSQNTSLDMREFLATDKAMQSIQGELLNNTSKLIEIDKRVKRDSKKLEEVENDSSYTDKQRQLNRDRLDDLSTEKQARLEILSQNRKYFQTQVARIKQTIEKVLDQDTSLAGKIHTLFKEQGITIFSILIVLSVSLSTIFLAITGVFGAGGGTGGS